MGQYPQTVPPAISGEKKGFINIAVQQYTIKQRKQIGS